ncbi:hypothetical protein GCM10009641_09010 [Mycobacterium cookii]|uniref:Uncharacterized protein n=1 Tax=Mycobacterium cookii TaxID=1775 RepID=A0A7I7L131_9MYCO|nr:hypothetical protein MCOO_40700 [Mycobacterium cookii]
MSQRQASARAVTNGDQLIGEIAGAATAVGVFIAAAGLFAQTRARKFGLAQVYIKRYWEVAELFVEDDRLRHDSTYARRYLRLREDEFDAARLGWVDIAVWRAWHEGIRSQVKTERFEVDKYGQLKHCTERNDHEAAKCPGLGKISCRRRLSWRFESLFGS